MAQRPMKSDPGDPEGPVSPAPPRPVPRDDPGPAGDEQGSSDWRGETETETAG